MLLENYQKQEALVELAKKLKNILDDIQTELDKTEFKQSYFGEALFININAKLDNIIKNSQNINSSIKTLENIKILAVKLRDNYARYGTEDLYKHYNLDKFLSDVPAQKALKDSTNQPRVRVGM